MVVCKFYAKGYCKFGNGCRFEHDLPNGRRDNSNNGYAGSNQSGQRFQQEPQQYFGQQHHSQQRQFGQQQQQHSSHQQSQQRYFGQHQQSQHRQAYFGQQQSTNRQSNNADPDLEQQTYMAIVEKDSLEWENGNQWPFSVYAPLLRRLLHSKNSRNDETLPGLIDLSPEELRWEAMQLHASGQFAEYLNKLQTISASQQTIRRGLQKIDPATARFIAAYERGDIVNPAGTIFQNTSSQPSMPVSSLLQSQPTAAAQSFSFSLPSGSAPPPAAASSFSFKLPSQTAFQQQPAVFQQSTFSAQAPIMPVQQSVFQQPTQVPIQQQQQPPVSFGSNPVIISHHPSLSTAELEQFKADKFSFGHIPRQPPPKELR